MAIPSVTWQFTNGTTSDASQINTDFTDIINAFTDGTRDLTIGSLVVSGATSLNGSVNLGDASADDITFLGSIAATIPVKTNATYNFGSATSALLSVYLGNGANKTLRLLAGTVGTSWTFTFPDNVPSITGQSLVFNTSGTASFRYPDKFTTSQTTTYAATGDETIIPCDGTSASFTVNLPAAATYVGKRFTFIKTDSDITKIITIDANSTETILPSVQASQLTYNLYTQYESVTIVSNGTSWYVVSHQAKSIWSTPVASTITGTSVNPAKGNSGTPVQDSIMYRRAGNFAQIRFNFKQTNATGAAPGTGDYMVLIPLTVDTTSEILDTTVYGTGIPNAPSLLGVSSFGNTSTNLAGSVLLKDSTHFKLIGTSGAWSAGVVALSGAIVSAYADFMVPISGWNP